MWLFQTWQHDDIEEQADMPFRQITEMTILTVQLIVEFAKGLPGFSKISQPDQITLLKVIFFCWSVLLSFWKQLITFYVMLGIFVVQDGPYACL